MTRAQTALRRKIVPMVMQDGGESKSRRAQWPIKRFRLGEEPPDDLSAVTTAAERIAMMWPLAETAWRLSGRTLPAYERRAIPLRFFPPGTRVDGDDA